MKTAFWSPTPFSGRKSANLLLLAAMDIRQDNREQLILHADPRGSGPEHFLLGGSDRRRMWEKKEFGLSCLWGSLCCNGFSKECAKNASYTFWDGKLHVLPAGEESFYKEPQRAEMIAGIMKQAEKVFQNIWIELPAGRTEFTDLLLYEADVVVINLAQSPFELEKINEIPSFRNECFLLGAYENHTIGNLYNLTQRNKRLQGCCGVIPYYRRYLAACTEGKAEQFCFRETTVDWEGRGGFFQKSVEKAYMLWKERAQT